MQHHQRGFEDQAFPRSLVFVLNKVNDFVNYALQPAFRVWVSSFQQILIFVSQVIFKSFIDYENKDVLKEDVHNNDIQSTRVADRIEGIEAHVLDLGDDPVPLVITA